MPRACGTGSLFTGSDTHPTILCTYLVPLQLGQCFTVRVGAEFIHTIVRFLDGFPPSSPERVGLMRLISTVSRLGARCSLDTRSAQQCRD